MGSATNSDVNALDSKGLFTIILDCRLFKPDNFHISTPVNQYLVSPLTELN